MVEGAEGFRLRHAIRVVDAEGRPLASSLGMRRGDEDVLAEMPVLYQKPLLQQPMQGSASPWSLQVVATSHDVLGRWQGATRTWLALLAAMVVPLVAGGVFVSRLLIHDAELARLRKHLTSNISHELRTPLSLIRLYTETLEKDRVKNDEERVRFLQIIGRESNRLTHLINNILDFDRIEEGRKQYSFAPISPSLVVQDTIDAYRFQLTEKGFDLRSDIAGDVPQMMLDDQALAQALVNLLDNAAKYSSTVKEIGVSLRQEGGEIVLAVADRGMGIPVREQSKVFDSFYRVDKGLRHDVQGSGLGLAVVKHVAEAHGGRVELESTPGQGSTFTVRLPLDFQPSAST